MKFIIALLIIATVFLGMLIGISVESLCEGPMVRRVKTVDDQLVGIYKGQLVKLIPVVENITIKLKERNEQD